MSANMKGRLTYRTAADAVERREAEAIAGDGRSRTRRLRVVRSRASLRDVVAGFPRGPEDGRRGDPGMFPPGSIAREINAETRLLLGGGRALLLQLAHPLVAAAVADHSDFSADPFARLWRTLDATLTVSFGDAEQSEASAARVRARHADVRGARDGRGYDARAPDLGAWVHATLVDSALLIYERFVGPLAEEAKEDYYRDMKRQALAFGVPATALPTDLAAFRAYLNATISSIEVSAEAVELSREILRPPAPPALAPAAACLRLVTVGTLPERLRAGYGLAWSPSRERALTALALAARAAGPLLPDAVGRWPHARTADRRMAARRRRGPGVLRRDASDISRRAG